MAAITPYTPSAVVPDPTTLPGQFRKNTYRANEVIDAGEPVYLVSSTSGVGLTDADNIESSQVIGIAVSSATAAGQYIEVVEYGLVTVGSSLETGRTIFIHTTAGGLTITEGDLSTGDFPAIVGFYYSATKVFVRPVVFGIAKA